MTPFMKQPCIGPTQFIDIDHMGCGNQHVGFRELCIKKFAGVDIFRIFGTHIPLAKEIEASGPNELLICFGG